MKKFLALIVACVIVASSYAATTYDPDEFMTAAPVLLKGTLKGNTWMLDFDACALDKGKFNYPVYMSFCQPCIRCLECVNDENDEPLPLTYGALYIIDKDSKGKIVYITEVELDDLTADVAVGKKGIDAKKGDVVMQLEDLGTQKDFGDVSDITLVGTWNQKTWFTGKDENSGGAKVKAIMGIIQKLDGCVESVNDDGTFWACGTLALPRDDSFTKKLMLAMTDDDKGKASSNPFLNCGEDDPDLDDCEEVMTTPSTAGDYDGYTMTQAYILKKSVPKKYEFKISQ